MEGRASGILPHLLQISAVASAHSDEKQAMEIDTTARACLSSALNIIPAVEFVSRVTTLLAGIEDKRVSVERKLPPGRSSDSHPSSNPAH
jgi:hypothetical protein